MKKKELRAKRLQPSELGTIKDEPKNAELKPLTKGFQENGPYDLFWPNPMNPLWW